METVLNIDPSLFLDEENALRKCLPGGFLRHVLKWIPVFPDKIMSIESTAKSDILCITNQGHLFQFDSNKNIIRTCDLDFKKLLTKADKLELKTVLSSNNKWYIVVLFQTSCYIYEQGDLSFSKIDVKTGIKSIDVDDFMVVGSQQLKLIFQNSTQNSLITDFNPISPIYNKLDDSNVPNVNVSNALQFQFEKSKLSLERARKEVDEDEESILSACRWFSKDVVGTNLVRESELVSQLLGKDNFKNVNEIPPDNTEHQFIGLKTNSFVFQYCGQSLLIHSIEFVQPTAWKVTGVSTNLIPNVDKLCPNNFKVYNQFQSFAQSESIAEVISSLFAEEKGKSGELEKYHCVVQEFEESLIHSHVGKIEAVIEVSNSSGARSIRMPSIDLKDINELAECDENVQNIDKEDISIEQLYGILTLMRKKALRVSSIASELPSAFSSCLKKLKFQSSNKFPNVYYNLKASSNLKGIVIIIRNEKPLKLKLDLFAANDNVLKVFVRKCYSILPQDSEIDIIKVEPKMKNSKLLQQKNCLFKEISLLNSLFQPELDRNDGSNILPKITEENESMKNYNERKRKFETRNSNVEIPLQNFLDFQKEIEILEQETDLAFT